MLVHLIDDLISIYYYTLPTFLWHFLNSQIPDKFWQVPNMLMRLPSLIFSQYIR